ncbi:DNA protecting protein DprA [Candidatus Jorgensenbacteria bacterium GWA1_54_12]|uniref:DNA protecting protein DprA n=1 Tax=Candidatus Jorgensenbacteria bacterium GWA1_54_12 TaxID=1798468 RepID=A0A1F6BKP2_9BACT|nr:MAG: DNA protecting protein DprA [Candidatus Jorgensenbacteria bacterium GWA1_54_12]
MSNVVRIEDDAYPARLREVPKAPEVLWYKGAWRPQLFEQCLAVVGTRQMTRYGNEMARTLVREIAGAGVTIVSGFMYGIDAAAHAAAVEVGGRTIAVMPCGIEVIHPHFQKDLYRAILDRGGLVVSEYAGNAAPELWTYPARNRIVAGLSQAVLVVEGGERSGSLITANLGRAYGRRIFAVPGPATSLVSRGTLQLLKSGEAEMVTEASDVLKYFAARIEMDTNPPENVAQTETAVPREMAILHLLEREPMTIDELSEALATSAEEVGTVLALLELQGAVSEELGTYYVN